MRLLEDRVIVGSYFTLAVTPEGRVIATEAANDMFDRANRARIEKGYTEATNWSEIYKVYEDYDIVIGLKYDGSLLFTKDCEGNMSDWVPETEMSKWMGITQLFRGQLGWYGVTKTGTVLFANKYGEDDDDRDSQDNVSGLKDIRRIVTEYNGRIICIKNDGTLCATKFNNGKDETSWDEMSKWRDIVDVERVPGRLVGIKEDGTLVATKYINDNDDYSQGGGR